MTAAGFLEECRSLYAGGKRGLFRYSQLGIQQMVSYETFSEEVRCLSHRYRTRWKSHSRIALLSENSYQYYKHIMAIICSGNTAVPINHTYSVEHIKLFAEMADADGIVCAEEFVNDVKERMKDCRCVSMDDLEEICDWKLSEEWMALQDEDMVLMLFSSGTSGKSKAVPLTNKNLFTYPCDVCREQKKTGNRNHQEISFSVLPFYHIGFNILLLEDMGKGRLIQLSDAKRMMTDLKEGEYDRIVTVPSMMKKILSSGEKSGIFSGSSPRIKEAVCVGAGMDTHLIRSLRSHGISPGVYYGLTETSGVVTGKGDYRDGSCGKVYPHCEVKIENGEILIRGANVMKGYYKNEEETKKVFRDGWFCTGDLGEMDKDGYLYVKGRVKNIIILSNGENVSPEELEGILYGCSLIKECRVYGEGERICAELFLGTDKDLAEIQAEVEKYLKDINRELPATHRIREIHIADKELKKNSVGKLIR